MTLVEVRKEKNNVVNSRVLHELNISLTSGNFVEIETIH